MAKWALILAILLSGQGKVGKVTAKQIFTENQGAIVHVYADGKISGCGFYVSEDGFIVTASHVVSTAESNFIEQAKIIEVSRVGEAKSHIATVIDRSSVTDTALLRVVGSQFPHVTLGKWGQTEVADVISVVTFLPGTDFTILLVGVASGTGEMRSEPLKANVVVFQAPIRKGFSGSPVFDSQGQVIGIVSTRMINMSPDLDTVRNQLNVTPKQQGITITGVDFGRTTLALINSLDADLVSGLGSAISISYAQEMIKKAQNQKP